MSFTNQKTKAKEAAGEEAAKWIKEGMVVGLGSGTTVFFFIKALIERCRNGLNIQVVSSSKHSAELAREGGIHILDLNDIEKIDLTVDGADEIDPQKRMIKGGGGALLREKMLANASDEMVVIIDESKVVNKLGSFPLPLEVLPFGYRLTKKLIEKKGYLASVREKDNRIYITDNDHYIIDVKFNHLSGTPEEHQEVLSQIPGVLETGFFFNLAGRVIVGNHKGEVDIWI